MDKTTIELLQDALRRLGQAKVALYAAEARLLDTEELKAQIIELWWMIDDMLVKLSKLI